jgi:DNA uptake protein ComE-like DNA-binding protein
MPGIYAIAVALSDMAAALSLPDYISPDYLLRWVTDFFCRGGWLMSVPQRIPPPGRGDPVPRSGRVLDHPNGWLLLVGLGFGITTWAAFLYIGLRARQRAWLAWSAVYGVLLVLFGVLEGPRHPSAAASAVGTLAFLGAWLGGTAHAAVVRNNVTRRTTRAADGTKLDAARQRIERRAEGRRLIARDPRLAREAGVGRPDLAGSEDFGLIDVNHASPDALCRLPGISPETARRIAETREGVGFFKSADDLGINLDLPPAVVDEIREYTVFL